MRPSPLTRVGLALVGFFAVATGAAAASEAFTIRDVQTITPPGYYNGWPTVARLANDRLLVVWSGGRDAHVCPFGRVEAMMSRDGGATWSWPRVLADSILDDRDAGVFQTQKGTVLVTTFVSEVYAHQPLPKDPERAAKWQRAKSIGTPEEYATVLGPQILRSFDAGVTWTAETPVPVNSPHGPFQLANGRLLYAGVSDAGKAPAAKGEERIVGVWESKDEGATWELLSRIAPRRGDRTAEYHELHGVEAADGTLLVHIRSHAGGRTELQTLQTESRDGGRTWSEPHAIGIKGYPSHLLRLRDDRLLMSYTNRLKPYEIHARLSSDNGKTWSEPMVLTSNEHSSDLGYPSTVQLKDGSLVTVWYEQTPASRQAVLRQARWTLGSAGAGTGTR